MRYFKLTDDVHVAGRWHIGELVDDSGVAPRLRIGLPYGGGGLRPEPLGVRGRPLEFTLTSFAVPVVTSKLAAAMAAVEGAARVQRIPLELPELPAFEALNFLRLEECIDETKSEFLKWTTADHRPDLAGRVRSVTHLRLDPDRIPIRAHVFRIRDWPICVVVSESMMYAMRAAGCLGARFTEVT